MKFIALCILSMLLVSSLNVVSGHECLNIGPMPNFDMKQFLGTWYAIETTSPQSRCLVYEFGTKSIQDLKKPKKTDNIMSSNCINSTNSDFSSHLKDCEDCPYSSYCTNCKKCILSFNCHDSVGLERCSNVRDSKYCKDSSNLHRCTNVIGLSNVRDLHIVIPKNYSFVGVLEPAPTEPAKITVSSILDIPEKSSFVVFGTDYTTYAGVYSCRKMADGYKHSVTILSRSHVLDKKKLKKLKKFVASAHDNPDDVKFSIADQKDCNYITPYTNFNADSIKNNVIGDDEKVCSTVTFMSDEEIDVDTVWMP